MELKIKPAFEEKYRGMIGEEYCAFAESLWRRTPKSIRANTLKTDKVTLVKRLENKGWKLRQMPWFDSGLIVEQAAEGMTKSLEHYLGYYYIQESASMVPPLFLEPTRGDVILDLAAAPGSKTTQMAQMMENQGLIMANDVNEKRLKALRGNLQKMGVANTVVTCMDALAFSGLGMKFDKILLDAPCSASGTIVNSWRIMSEWSEPAIKRLGNVQKRLIASASKCLEEDGVLVYSTCSMEPEEDEEVVDFAVRNLGLAVEEFKVKGLVARSGFAEHRGKKFDESVRGCTRIFPQDNGTEGFFICRLRK